MRRALKLMAVGATGLILTAAVGAAVHARDGHGPGHRGGGMHPIKMFETFDANADGSVSQEEINAVRIERITSFDVNGDGAVDLKEYEAVWLDAMRERMVDRFQHLDADGSGVVTAEEFTVPFARAAARFDSNGDGVVTRDEIQERRRGFKRHEGGERGKRHGDDHNDAD